MSDVSAFFDKLYQLLRHEQLWGPLAIVLPVMALGGFRVGQFFPKHPPPFQELKDEIKRLQAQLTIGPGTIRRARDAVSPLGPGLWLSNPNSLRSYIAKSGAAFQFTQLLT